MGSQVTGEKTGDPISYFESNPSFLGPSVPSLILRVHPFLFRNLCEKQLETTTKVLMPATRNPGGHSNPPNIRETFPMPKFDCQSSNSYSQRIPPKNVSKQNPSQNNMSGSTDQVCQMKASFSQTKIPWKNRIYRGFLVKRCLDDTVVAISTITLGCGVILSDDMNRFLLPWFIIIRELVFSFTCSVGAFCWVDLC